jgi:hypothetical protein
LPGCRKCLSYRILLPSEHRKTLSSHQLRPLLLLYLSQVDNETNGRPVFSLTQFTPGLELIVRRESERAHSLNIRTVLLVVLWSSASPRAFMVLLWGACLHADAHPLVSLSSPSTLSRCHRCSSICLGWCAAPNSIELRADCLCQVQPLISQSARRPLYKSYCCCRATSKTACLCKRYIFTSRYFCLAW